MRHPLARALATVGLDADDVAARLTVDPKTVQRWFAGRLPYPRNRTALANLTGWTVADLWPETIPRLKPDTSADELRVTYPHRSAVPTDVWHRHFANAQHDIGILAFSALFSAEDATILRTLQTKARQGIRVRIALGDHTGTHIARRGADEGIDDIMGAKIRNALVLFRPLTNEPGVEIRLHDTVLYNSIYRSDNDLLVNTHIYSCPAGHAPVLHLRLSHPDGMAAAYMESFERVWAQARPAS
ncbi:transcriptional regulator [Rhizocola hellebori]|uniref:Transcriptional regulator n=1 Tax=Rhizocola hellebori TaxID=1392758 RepID=A0A8J3QCI5_9ACTN|nr:XRE family transcriptional regulator [Rhizocola hellebori]GIH08086.1 transcriptional regulator [Rhizocola hellebori]